MSFKFNIAQSERRAQFVASQMYKITHDLAPKRPNDYPIYFMQRLPLVVTTKRFFHKFFLPQPKIDYLKKSLSYRGANCGIASQMIYEIKNHLLHAFKTSIRALDKLNYSNYLN